MWADCAGNVVKLECDSRRRKAKMSNSGLLMSVCIGRRSKDYYCNQFSQGSGKAWSCVRGFLM